MTFDEFKLAVVPRHEAITHDLERGKTLNKARANILFSSAYAYETGLMDAKTIEHTFAEDHVTHMLYDCVCKAFSNSLIVERMILRAYEYGLKDGSTNCFTRDRADILKAVGFDE